MKLGIISILVFLMLSLSASIPVHAVHPIESSCSEDSSTSNPPGFDCYIKYQKYLRGYDGRFTTAAFGGFNCRVINPLDLNLTNIFPHPNERLAPGHMQDWLEMGGGISAAILTASTYLGLGLLGSAVQLLTAVSVCTYTAVLTPQEYYAWQKQNNYPINSSEQYISSMPSKELLPYYFHCNPEFQPLSLSTGTSTSSSLTLSRSWGYPGAFDSLCSQGINSPYQAPEMVNTIAVAVQQSMDMGPKLTFGTYKFGDGTFQTNNTEILVLSPYDKPKWSQKNGAAYVAYYRQNPVKICAGIVSFAYPIEVGCTSTSPRVDYASLPTAMQKFINGTRCKYLDDQREDLFSLGSSSILVNSYTRNTIDAKTDRNGYSGLAMAKFLMSDLHFLSTTVGCIKDMLLKKFVADPQNPSSVQNYFQLLQKQIKPIIYAVLALYFSLLGIKIISRTQPISRGEAILHIIKVAIVIYFTLGDGWYSQDTSRPGLFKPLVYASDQLSNLFLQAFNSNDVVGLCRFQYNNYNLLSETEIPITAASSTVSGATLIPTPGADVISSTVRLTVWDLLDCHVANYMTFGSCNYTAAGLVAVWLISLGFWTLGTGALVAIVSFIYVIMVFLVVFRFAHTYIICLISIAILALVSPIFLCFMLFEPTKRIFEEWGRMLLNNIFYPALLFGFLALMLTAFNAVYYGNLNIRPGTSPQDFYAACTTPSGQTINSMFCTVVKNFTNPGDNICNINWLRAVLSKVEKKEIPPFGNFSYLNPSTALMFTEQLSKLLVIAIIFYHFSNEILSFMATLLRTSSLADFARGRVNLVGAAKASYVLGAKATWTGLRTSAQVTKSAGKALYNSSPVRLARRLLNRGP